MADLGDEWEEIDVERVYGDYSLSDALALRRGEIKWFTNILYTVVEAGYDISALDDPRAKKHFGNK